MDTSYLSNGYSTTQGALLQSSALYENYKDAIEFEYNVQKWLGTFGSVGVQQSTLQSLAQGINYLGTGNITGLQGNQSLLNLMTFAASQSGLNLIDMMNRGINAKEANKLLSAIVSFGQNIGQTGSRVAMSQYAEMFGLDVSDIVALSNLTQTDISNILGTNLTYSGAMGELGSQLKQVGKRQHLAQQIDNVIDNLVYTTAGGIADNVGMYTTWRVASLLGDVLGDAFSIPVPLVGKISIEDTIKAGLAGASLGMGLIGQVGASISKGELSMSNWGASETLSRGEGKTQVVGGASRTLS